MPTAEEIIQKYGGTVQPLPSGSYQPAMGPQATHDIEVTLRTPAAGAGTPEVDAIVQKYGGTVQGAPTTPQTPPAQAPQPEIAPGMPASEFQAVSQFLDVPKGTLKDLGKMAAATGISTATSVGGAALGGAIAGPPGALAGGMAGNFAGRKINVALGLEEPGLVGDVVSVVAPPVMNKVTTGRVLPAGVRPAATQQVLETAEQHGVPVSYGDVTQGPLSKKVEQYLEQVPGIGTSGFRKMQQAAAKTAAEEMSDDLHQRMVETSYRKLPEVQQLAKQGDKAAQRLLEEVDTAGSDWTRIVQASGNLRQFRAKLTGNKLYDRVNALADQLGGEVPLANVPVTQTTQAVETALESASAAKLTDTSTVKLLEKVRDSLQPWRDNRFGTLRGLRTDLDDEIAQYAARGDAKSVRYLTQIRNALDGDLETFALNSPNADLQRAWRRADDFHKTHVVPYEDRQLASALKDANPDEVYGKFIQRGKGDRATQFYTALDPKGKAAVRYGMVQEALETATQPTTGVFTPAKFAGSLERIRDASGVFFTGQDKWELDGFTKLMRHVERAGQFAENPPTGNRLVPLALTGTAGAGLVTHPGLTALGLGSTAALKWLLTSQRGRNLLLSVSDAAPGSASLERIVQTIGREAARVVTADTDEESK